jgi:hypothetical protein
MDQVLSVLIGLIDPLIRFDPKRNFVNPSMFFGANDQTRSPRQDLLTIIFK